MDKLKRCPFCIGKVEVKWDWSSRPDKIKIYSVYGHKPDCFLKGIRAGYYDKKDLIKAWNTRQPPKEE